MPTATSPTDQIAALRTGVGVIAPQRGFVHVEGAGAEAFLQSMLSQELTGIQVGESRRALLLTPKARVLADPRVTRLTDDAFLLDLEVVGVEPLVRELTRYRLGAKVVIEATADWSLLSLIGPAAETIDLPGLQVESRLGTLPRRDFLIATPDRADALTTAETAGAVAVEAAAVDALRVEAGELLLGADVDDRWMPAEVGLVDAAVSFDKGCYIGQEPVTRLHRRGHANRGPRRLTLSAPVRTGESIVNDGRDVGVVTSLAGPPWLDGNYAIGIVRVKVPDDAVLQIGVASGRLLPEN